MGPEPFDFGRIVVRPSALKHGIGAERIRHVTRACRTPLQNPVSPNQVMCLAPDQHGNPLEVVGLIDADGSLLVLHAMPLRPAYRAIYMEVNGHPWGRGTARCSRTPISITSPTRLRPATTCRHGCHDAVARRSDTGRLVATLRRSRRGSRPACAPSWRGSRPRTGRRSARSCVTSWRTTSESVARDGGRRRHRAATCQPYKCAGKIDHPGVVRPST